MGNLGFIWTLVIGAVAGLIASKIMKRDAEMGGIENILTGIVGGYLGNWLLGNYMSGKFSQLVSATIGAVILLFILGLIQKNRNK
ncbi:GlsB/YeaQ/YmgE family stress response membrane protein [uncultured Anaerococcus sp.]|uniref:GlsB/YeaQ/YmgE family stress response membrane protein n=1 Tax=uncultured Anaerococcus sp. TaxID=293428 RepID=UPI0025F0CA7E|nr:GlsB/YeaQ/YmgE family stress response membrane protein [uncultured Anaerococcus sp.]